MTTSTAEQYDVMSDKEGWVESWPRTPQGAITATRQACRLSVKHGPHEIQRDGTMIARFVDGRRDGLPPGGIAKVLDAKTAKPDDRLAGEAPQRSRGETVKINVVPATRRAARLRAVPEQVADDPVTDVERERLERLLDPTGGE
jgi:hypothetical protein